MDPRDFTDVFSVRMGVLFDIMAGDADALTVAAHLVQSSSVGRVFNALLARYLTEHKLALLADHASNVSWHLGGSRSVTGVLCYALGARSSWQVQLGV